MIIIKKVNKTTTIVVSTLALLLIGLGTIGVTQAFAQSNGNPGSGLIAAIAQKFGW